MNMRTCPYIVNKKIMSGVTDLDFDAIAWHTEDFKAKLSEPAEYVMKAFGRDASGRSQSLTITGFKPFFYIKLPDQGWTLKDVTQLFKAISKEHTYMKEKLSSATVKIIKRRDAWGFSNFEEFNFLKLSFKTSKSSDCTAMFFNETELSCPALHSKPHLYKVYESNVDPLLRFFHTKAISPCGWIKVNADHLVPTTILATKSQNDFQASHDAIVNSDPELKRPDSPILVMSFSIKCTPNRGGKDDTIAQIGATVQTLGESASTASHVFLLGPCSRSDDGTQYCECENEAQLLLRFAGLIESIDPDIIVGYENFSVDCARM